MNEADTGVELRIDKDQRDRKSVLTRIGWEEGEGFCTSVPVMAGMVAQKARLRRAGWPVSLWGRCPLWTHVAWRGTKGKEPHCGVKMKKDLKYTGTSFLVPAGHLAAVLMAQAEVSCRNEP